MSNMNVGTKVKHKSSSNTGVIVSMSTELGGDTVSVRWDVQTSWPRYCVSATVLEVIE